MIIKIINIMTIVKTIFKNIHVPQDADYILIHTNDLIFYTLLFHIIKIIYKIILYKKKLYYTSNTNINKNICYKYNNIYALMMVFNIYLLININYLKKNPN